MPTQMADIFLGVVAPVLAMVVLGAVVQRLRPLNLDTLVKLNLYVFVPAFLFVRLLDSTLSWVEIGKIGLAVLLPMAMLAAAIVWALRRAKARAGTIAAVVVGGLFFNAGNFGIPVAELAFGQRGGAVQALVVVFMNTAIFFLGYGILAAGQGRGPRAVLGYFKLPMIYVIVAALAMRETDRVPPAWLHEALRLLAAGMVPIALLTLGAQLALRPRWPRWRLIVPVTMLKLIAMPAAMAVVVWLLGLWPWPGAQLVLAAAAPTAVNTLLLTLELDGDADTAADCVFWTTLACAATVTGVLAIVLALGGGPP